MSCIKITHPPQPHQEAGSYSRNCISCLGSTYLRMSLQTHATNQHTCFRMFSSVTVLESCSTKVSTHPVPICVSSLRIVAEGLVVHQRYIPLHDLKLLLGAVCSA